MDYLELAVRFPLLPRESRLIRPQEVLKTSFPHLSPEQLLTHLQQTVPPPPPTPPTVLAQPPKHPPHDCATCGKQLPTERALARHMLCHTPPSIHCTECTATFRRREDMVRHARSHHGSRRYVCDQPTGACGPGGCGRGFIRRDALVRHVRRGKEKLGAVVGVEEGDSVES